MAFIQKRIDSKGRITYRARVRVKGAKDKSATFKTEREAIRWGQRIEVEAKNGRDFDEEGRKKTFADFIDYYIKNKLIKNPLMHKKQTPQLLWWKQHLGSYYQNSQYFHDRSFRPVFGSRCRDSTSCHIQMLAFLQNC